jgi:acyl carrier protein
MTETMTRQDIEAKVIELCKEQYPKTLPTLHSDLINDLGFDSMDIIELVFAIEEDFDIGVPDDIGESWNTVEDIVKWLLTCDSLILTQKR